MCTNLKRNEVGKEKTNNGVLYVPIIRFWYSVLGWTMTPFKVQLYYLINYKIKSAFLPHTLQSAPLLLSEGFLSFLTVSTVLRAGKKVSLLLA